MPNLVWRNLRDLSDLVQEVTGERPTHHQLVAAAQRIRPESNTLLGMARGHLRVIQSSLANEDLAGKIGRLSLRACGPDVSPREIYPSYRAAAVARGLKPWSFSAFKRSIWGGQRPGLDTFLEEQHAD